MEFDTSEYKEPTHEEAVADCVALIRKYAADNNTHLSTSQLIMVGLALCRPDLLEEAQYPPRQIKAAWKRLDGAQRDAIITWWK